MFSFSSIAVFILSTISPHPRSTNSLSDTLIGRRAASNHATWAGYFPNTFYVMGSNKRDFDYLQANCDEMVLVKIENNSTSTKRRLVPKEPQIPSEDSISIYHCSAYNSSRIPLKVLMIKNCTGEYFGLGPTCRCQESIRYFRNVLSFHFELDWFLFLDDDVYLRPFSLISLLKQMDISHPNPAALISAEFYRGFDFSTRWNRKTHKCASASTSSISLAQPAFLNRKAIDAIFSCLECNCMIQLQNEWGGSHDAILGTVLWMYNIPTFSFAP